MVGIVVSKFKFSVSVGQGRASEVVTVEELGFSEEEWQALDEDEQEQELTAYLRDSFIPIHMSSGWEPVEE